MFYSVFDLSIKMINSTPVTQSLPKVLPRSEKGDQKEDQNRVDQLGVFSWGWSNCLVELGFVGGFAGSGRLLRRRDTVAERELVKSFVFLIHH